MIKLIIRILIELTLVLGGAAIVWYGLSNDNDILIFLGIVPLLSGVALARFRFWSNLMR